MGLWVGLIENIFQGMQVGLKSESAGETDKVLPNVYDGAAEVKKSDLAYSFGSSEKSWPEVNPRPPDRISNKKLRWTDEALHMAVMAK